MMDLNLLKNTNLPDTYKNVEIVNLIGDLPVNPRYTWEQLKGARDINAITTIVLHHTALSKTSTAKYDDVTLISRIATSHIKSTRNIPGGDPGLPYHGVIRSGNVYICNKVTDFLYGVSGNNTYTIHLSVDGDYTKEKLEEADFNALVTAVLLFRANMPKFKNILAHKELDKTACPGYDYAHVRAVVSTLTDLADKPPIDAEVSSKIEAVKLRINDLYKTSTMASKYAPIAQQYLTGIYDVMKKEGIL